MPFLIDATAVLLAGLLWLGAVLFLRLRRGKSVTELFYATVFYVYVVKVLDYTLFQFQSLFILKYFLPNLMLNGDDAGDSVNLIPLLTLTPGDVKTSLLNILLFVPFGFGLPFVTSLRMGKTVLAGAFFSVAIELLQWTSGWVAGMTFRVADVNDVLFNALGAAIGYALFAGFVRLCRRFFHNVKNPLFRHIVERPQRNTTR